MATRITATAAAENETEAQHPLAPVSNSADD
jgi:hypothetical protein